METLCRERLFVADAATHSGVTAVALVAVLDVAFSIAAGVLTSRGRVASEARRYLLLVIVAMVAPLLIASGLFRCALPSPADVLGLVGGCLVGLWCGPGVWGRRRGHASDA